MIKPKHRSQEDKGEGGFIWFTGFIGFLVEAEEERSQRGVDCLRAGEGCGKSNVIRSTEHSDKSSS